MPLKNCIVICLVLLGVAFAQDSKSQNDNDRQLVAEQTVSPTEKPMASFMGAKWGESMSYFKANFKYAKALHDSGFGYYIYSHTIGDVSIGEVYFVFKVNDSDELRSIEKNERNVAKFSTVQFSIKPEQYEPLFKIFKEKYGDPFKEDISEIQNRMGAKFEQRVAIWVDDEIKRKVTLSKYAGKIDKGLASFDPIIGVDADKEKEKLKKAAEDF